MQTEHDPPYRPPLADSGRGGNPVLRLRRGACRHRVYCGILHECLPARASMIDIHHVTYTGALWIERAKLRPVAYGNQRRSTFVSRTTRKITDLAGYAADDPGGSTSKTRRASGCAREAQMQIADAWEEWWRGLGHVARCNRDKARTREAFEAGYAAGRLTRQRAADDAAATARGTCPGAPRHETWRATRAAREST